MLTVCQELRQELCNPVELSLSIPLHYFTSQEIIMKLFWPECILATKKRKGPFTHWSC